MLADKIITLLDGVKNTGKDCWIARCPAHEDKTPSLAIREADDKLLLHCFAGCSYYEIVSAARLDPSDLFPDKPRSHKSISRPFPAQDVLRCLSNEVTVLMLVASDLAKEEKLDSETKDRLMQAASRFHSALSVGGLT